MLAGFKKKILWHSKRCCFVQERAKTTSFWLQNPNNCDFSVPTLIFAMFQAKKKNPNTPKKMKKWIIGKMKRMKKATMIMMMIIIWMWMMNEDRLLWKN